VAFGFLLVSAGVGEPWHKFQHFIRLGSYRTDESKVQIQQADGSYTDFPEFEAWTGQISVDTQSPFCA
jgi:hypothetical protein